MKKTFILSVLTVLVIASIVAVSARVGSPDEECQDNGFDFGIVKYECDSTTGENGSYAGSYDITISWNKEDDECVSADWTADPAVDGVLSKEATNTYVHSGGTSGTITKTGQYAISHITFCGNEVPVIPEFGIIAGVLTLVSAVVAFFIIRKN